MREHVLKKKGKCTMFGMVAIVLIIFDLSAALTRIFGFAGCKYLDCIELNKLVYIVNITKT